ncbi:rhodanese-like domain-containing protein [Prauserella cavernicola]|uniref:Ketopantoate reductase n=1 Tax=Prauserella cavernicola TaxID=2800127 RepID=A0A934QQU1_9PSEU|nr:rhodanese-like domain-containing protein [Prauserella cavernicola]MBK1783719.1 ketopantoate reductase [Prauserella cavernicola]
MTRYVIIGAGAVGATVAAQLSLSGAEVVLVARGDHGAALRADGLRYVRPDGTHVVRLPVVSGPDELELTADDVLVLATKSQHTEQALQDWSWRPVAGGGYASDLPVLVLQNGLDNERAALRRFRTVFGAVVWMPSEFLRPGEVVARGGRAPGLLWLGRYPGGKDPRLSWIADDLREAGFGVQVVTDLPRWKLAKLLGNLRNAPDALYGRGEHSARVGEELETEARAVFDAAGLAVADLAAESDVDLSLTAPAEIPGLAAGGNSTWQSLARAAGSVEVDYLNGEIVLLGRLHGVATPRNEAVRRELVAAAARDRAAEVLVSAASLAVELDSPEPPVLLDVRWALGDPDGHRHFAEGHLPGAVYVDLDTELAATPSTTEGRHPLPDLADLQDAARRWGVRDGASVVVYDDNGGLSAARAWWLLRWGGVSRVRLLDGGLRAWQGELHSGEGDAPERGDVVLEPGHLPVLTADDAAALPGPGALLDARAGARYRGEEEPVDPRAGHIPGALSAPTGDNLTADGRFRPATELAARFRELGARAGVGVYCGSGVTAAHQVAALAIAGIDAALYPGSWSQWSADPGRPAVTGPHPTERSTP